MGQIDVNLTEKQRRALGFLSYKYGNGGSMCSADNHKFLTALISGDNAEAFQYAHRITKPCQEALDRILKNDFRELRPNQQKMLDEVWQENGRSVTEV